MNTPDKRKSDGLRKAVLVLAAAIAIIVAGYLALLPPSTTPDSPDRSRAPDMILISIDTLRADRLACYGYTQSPAPAIDRFAAESVLFERCYTPYPLTLPAHLSMLSGTSPVYHRVRDNTQHRVPERGLRLLQEELTAAGYAAGGFVSAPTLAKDTGIDRGFGYYDDALPRQAGSDGLILPERLAADTLKAAGDWLEKRPADQSTFLFIHLFDVHFPYWPPAPFNAGLKAPESFTGKELSPLYDAEVRYTDHELGRFFERLKNLKRYDNAVIVLTADHGEGLGEHGELTHGYFLYAPTTHVPLIIRRPGGANGGTRIPGIVQTGDLFQTMLTQAGLAMSEEAQRQQQSHDLSDMLVGKVKDAGYDAYIETHYGYLNAGWSKVRAIRRGDTFGVVHDAAPEFYRLNTPGGEKRNLLADMKSARPEDLEAWRAMRERVSRILTQWYNPGISDSLRARGGGSHYAYGHGATPDPFAAGQGPSPYPVESITTLSRAQPETLGDADQRRPAPHTRSEALRHAEEAELFYSRGQYALAAERLEALLRDTPDALQGLKLAARTNYDIARSLSGDRRAAERHTRRAADYAHRASEVCATLGFEAAVIDLEATALLYRLMLGESEAVRERARELGARLAEGADETFAASAMLREQLTRLEYMAAYRLADGADKRAEIGARFERELGGEDNTARRMLIDLMKRGDPLQLAPWE